MGLDKEKQEQPKEVIALPSPKEKTKHIVLKNFTLDKPYFPKNTIELEAGKVKDTLISNKFIK